MEYQTDATASLKREHIESKLGTNAEALSEKVNLRELCMQDTFRSVLEILLTWTLLGVSLYLVTRPIGILVKTLLFVFIATRQYALIILMHDAFHGLLSRSKKLNDFLARWFLAFPVGSVYDNPKSKHLLHHQFLGELKDPDVSFYERKNNISSLGHHFFISLLLTQVAYTFLGKKKNKTADGSPRYGMVFVAIVQLLIMGAFYLLGHWYYYILFWFLPIVTLVIFFDKVRIFCEHVPLSSWVSEKRAVLRTYSAHPIECFFVAPFDMNYHAEHHLYPGVPHFRLSVLRGLLDAKKIDGKGRWQSVDLQHSYLLFLSKYIRDL